MERVSQLQIQAAQDEAIRKAEELRLEREAVANRGILRVGWTNERFVDDLTGLPLPPDLCRAARKKELDYFKSKGAWDVRTVLEARQRMGRAPITVRWVETNKGDDENLVYRSRLVGKEFNDGQMDGLFAATPPLEALRFFSSMKRPQLELMRSWAPKSS